MTDQNSTNETPLPVFGSTHEPVYATDGHDVVREKLRAFITQAVVHHEERYQDAEPSEDSLPCLSLAIPCYLAGDSTEDHVAALQQPAHILATFSSECARMGYATLGVAPALFGVDDEEFTYQHGSDRATGWKVEITHKDNAPRFFNGEDDHITISRLWLELAIKTNGPAYAAALQQAQAGNEAQRQLQEIMGRGDLKA